MKKKILLTMIIFIGIVTVSNISTEALKKDSINKSYDDKEEKLYVENGILVCNCGNSLSSHRDNINLSTTSCICGSNLEISEVYRGVWYFNKNSKECIHYNNGHDYEQEQKVVYEATCNDCGLIKEINKTDVLWSCKGL